MLINGQHAEELRVAIVLDGKLESYQVEVAESGLQRGNIYRGVVANIEPSLDAAFIDYGGQKHGFLAGHDLIKQAWHRAPAADDKRPRLDALLEKGRTLLVQVTRDAAGTKGAVLTTNLSLPGRYLVLMPYDSSRGLSRKIEDDELRKTLKERAQGLSVPDGHGYIIRTSAADQTKAALKGDLSALLRLFKQVLTESTKGKGPRLLYDDQDLVVQALRDYLDASVEEVLVDDDRLLQKAQAYVRAAMPRSKLTLTRYEGRVPLFSRYNLEPQIDSIYQRVVALPGGGSIVIDHTEALTAIDVNSGKNTRGASHEETAYNTNLAAAQEVARQLRMRDIGGLVVVDFIDMRTSRHRGAVEKTLRDAMKHDKARSNVGRISSNGLLEINRQRIKQALGQRMHRTCPTCQGVGLLATPELVGLRLLRQIEARAATGQLRAAHVALHPELADAIQNKRRGQLAALESDFGIAIEIIAAAHLHRSEEEIEWEQNGSATTEQQPDAEPEGERKKARSSRRRGGRGRRAKAVSSVAVQPGATASSEAEPSEALDAVRTEPGIGAVAEAEPSAPATGDPVEGRSRRRRRRPRRRRHRPDGMSEASTESPPTEGLSVTPTEPNGVVANVAASPPPTAPAPIGTPVDSSASREPTGDKKSRPRRSRGGRSRRGPRKSAVASNAAEPNSEPPRSTDKPSDAPVDATGE